MCSVSCVRSVRASSCVSNHPLSSQVLTGKPACLPQQMIGVLEHATLEVLVLTRNWVECVGECNLVLRYARTAPCL